MEIGQLNQRITILENHTKIDEIGNHKSQWEELFSCWASVNVKISNENSDNSTTKEMISLEFIVRQNPDTLRISAPTHKLDFKNLIYDIKSVIPNFKSLDYMKIIADTRKVGAFDDFN